MPLSVPTLDDRTYQALAAELRERIPVYTPEWTEAQESDPAVTLLELFGFVSEEHLHRLRPDCKGGARVFLGRLIFGNDLNATDRSPRSREHEYLAPGVYVEEIPFRSRPIEGVSTSARVPEDLRARLGCRPPRNRRRRVAITVGAVALAAIVGIMFWRGRAAGADSKGPEDLPNDLAPGGAVPPERV